MKKFFKEFFHITRTGSVTVAKWAFATDNSSSEPITIDIAPTANASTLAAGKTMTISAVITGTQVAPSATAITTGIQ